MGAHRLGHGPDGHDADSWGLGLQAHDVLKQCLTQEADRSGLPRLFPSDPDCVYMSHSPCPVHSPAAPISVEETHVSVHAKLRGLYVITDTKLIPRDRFVETVEAAVRGGATMVQVRDKETPQEEVIRLGRELLAVTHRYGALLIINDHPAVAKAVGADGAHVGREDPPVRETRALLRPGRDHRGFVLRRRDACAGG